MDLEAFATAAGVPIRELSTNPLLSNIEVILSNGVKMKWRTFLNNASKYIYLTSSELGKNTHGKAETLDKLYGIIGVDRVKRESLTGEYFLEKNIENIRIDLQSFADMAGIQITELTTTTPKGNTKIILSNGIKRRWIDFLLNASKYLSGTEKGSDNPHRLAESLERLLKMLALKREKRELWTGEYFSDSNKEKLRKDIERYAQVGKVRIKELSTNTPKENTEVELSNGVEMKWGRFLRNASNFLLGTKNNSKESLPRKSEALDRLCEMVGIVREKQQFLSKEYFDVLNEENIRSDLEKYAEAGGVRIEKISTGTPEGNTEITLSNGARMKWNTFLMNASQHLLGTKQRSKENPPRKSDALYKLCEITGVVRAKKPKS